MRLIKKPKGFTLIEVTMVLAIGALLAVILFSMYGQTRQRAQFTDAIERVVTNLERAKTEANSSYTTGPGLNPGRAFYARTVAFSSPDQYQYQMSTLTVDRLESSTAVINLATESDVRTESLAWGIYCSSQCDSAVVFSRNLGDGVISTYIVNKNELLDEAEFTIGGPNDVSTLNLEFSSPYGYTATVSIDARTNEINRSYNF